MTPDASPLDASAPASLDELAAALDGTLTRPGDPAWNEERAAWNLAAEQHPIAVVRAASVDDLVRTVRAAAALGVRVAPQGPGHAAAALHERAALEGALLLRTSDLRSVVIDADAESARVGAGALWTDVVDAAFAHGLAALAGSSGEVGVVGYTLGGGLGWFARSHGLAANRVTAVDLVTADGQLRRVDRDHEPDLFWALRGGGGDFGVVAALEFALVPVTQVQAGSMMWPVERSAEVLTTWLDWVRTVPETVTSLARILQLPALPDVPEFLRGRSFVVVEAVMQSDAAAAAELIAPLRALGPELDTVHPMPVSELQLLHMDPVDPVPAVGDGMPITDLDAQALTAFLNVAGPGEGSALLSAELRHIGGASAPGRIEGGAISGVDAEFMLFAVGFAPSPPAIAAVHESLDRLFAALAPWRAATGYANFAERVTDDSEWLYGDALTRLREIRAAVDPNGMLVSSHPVG